jgi:hypothetical protein
MMVCFWNRSPCSLRKVKVKDGDRERNELEPEPGDSVAVQLGLKGKENSNYT